MIVCRIDAITGRLQPHHVGTGTGTTKASRSAASGHHRTFDAGHLRSKIRYFSLYYT
jgi:hypothetical protein